MNINKYCISKSYTVEIIPSNSAVGNQYNFPDIPYLRNKFIVGVAASQNFVGVTSGKLNLNLYAGVSLYPSFLTLADTEGKQFIQNMPIAELIVAVTRDSTALVANQVYTNNVNGINLFKPRNVAWTKSYVFFPTATGVANACLQFNIFYK